MHKTRFAGLTALDAGESILTDGGSVVTRNPEITDHFLEIGAKTHRHDAAPALADPTTVPTVQVFDAGGSLPSSTTILVAYTLLDGKGGETLPSPTALVTTSSGITAPLNPPVTEVDYDAGTLTIGTYYYAVTLVDAAGGETPASPLASVTRDPGHPNAHIVLSDLNSFVTNNPGAVRYRLYRAKDQGKLLLLSEGIQDTIDDDGSLECDCCTEPPAINRSTTGQTGLVTVVVPASAMGDAVGWRLYVTDDGEFYSPSKFGPDRLPADAGQQIQITTLAVDTGAPPDVSTTVAGAAKINPDTDILNWHWKQPVATASDLPEDANTTDGDVRLSLADGTIYLRVAGDWAPLTAPAAHFMPPVASFAALPTAGNSDGDIRLALDTYVLYAWSSADSTWHDALPGSGGGGGLAGHIINDELTPRPQRSSLAFVGSTVSVTDDAANDRTVVTITGAGGGGGGGASFPLSTREEVSWNDLEGNLVARLTVEDQVLEAPVYDFIFATAPDANPAANWADPLNPAASLEITGGKLVLHPDGFNKVFWPRYNTFGPVGNLVALVTFTIDSPDWTTIGVGNMLPAGSAGYGFAYYLTKTGTLRLDTNPNSGGAWTALNTTTGVAVPSVGDDITFLLTAYRGSLSYYAYNQTTGEYLESGDAVVPAALTSFQGIPAARVSFTADGSFHIKDARAATQNPYYDLVSYTGFDRHVLHSTSGAESWTSVGITMEPDWQNQGLEMRYDSDTTEVVMRGIVGKITGAPPVAGELIATLVGMGGFYYPRDGSVPVVTGDSDGVELGIATFHENELRWGDGRSSDPATKMPYMTLDGVRR